MRRPNLIVAILCLAVTGIWIAVLAQAPPRDRAPETRKSYGRPKKSRTLGRRGTGCASTANEPFLIAVLAAPEGQDATASQKPRLFWYISHRIEPDCHVILTVTCDPADQAEPSARASCLSAGSAEQVLTTPSEPGLQEATGPPLRPDIAYRWYISVGREWEGRSKDLVAGDWIQYAPEAPARWYDTFAATYDACSERVRAEVNRLGKSLDSEKETDQDPLSETWKWTPLFCSPPPENSESRNFQAPQ